MKSLLPLLVLVCVSACATPGISGSRSLPAVVPRVFNELEVEAAADEVWAKLVDGISSGFYIINNLERESGLINVSFASAEPELYIDCGQTIRTYQRGADTATYQYKVAESSAYRLAWALDGFPVTWWVNRKTSLDGRANVFVAERGQGQTFVRVNARFILSISVTGTYETENRLGKVIDRGPIDPSSVSIIVNTGQPTEVNFGDERSPNLVTCVSTGTFEAGILRVLR